jgi:hypothetical protein
VDLTCGMWVKTKEPINGSFTASSKVFKDTMNWNTTIMTDFKAGRVDKANTT